MEKEKYSKANYPVAQPSPNEHPHYLQSGVKESPSISHFLNRLEILVSIYHDNLEGLTRHMLSISEFDYSNKCVASNSDEEPCLFSKFEYLLNSLDRANEKMAKNLNHLEEIVG